MKKLKTIALSFMVAGATLFTGCTKEGPVGPAGKDGKDGNANVKSNTVFVNANEWVFKAGEATVTKQIPQITADIASTGVVMVYGKNGAGWDALLSIAATPNGLVITLGYMFEVGMIHIYFTWNVNVTLSASDIGNNEFRIVVLSSAARTQNPNVDLSDISQVETILMN